MGYQADSAVFVPVIPSFKDFRTGLIKGLNDPQVAALAGKAVEAIFQKGVRHADTRKAGHDAGVALVRAVDAGTMEEARKHSPFSAFGRSAGKDGELAGKKFADGFYRDSAGKLREANGRFASVGSAFTKSGESAGSHFAKGFGSKISSRGGGGGAGAGLVGLASKAVAPLAALFAAGKVVDFGKDSIAEARDSQKVGAQTAQTIKTTGQAAKITASQVGDLSTALSNKTGIDDETIQSGQNLLLTFTGIRNEVGKNNDIFNQASKTALDMTAALNHGEVTTTGLKSSSIQLGKALNDPVKGISALQRVGVSFTDQQKKQIKDLVAHGKTLDAQKIILKELNREFGGSAAATTTWGQKASVAFGNFKEQIGTALLPYLDKIEKGIVEKVIPAASKFVGFLSREIPPAVSAAKRFIGPLVTTITGLFSGKTSKGSGTLMTAFRGVLSAGQKLGAVVIPIIRQIVARFQKDWPKIKPIVAGIFKVIGGIVKDVMGFVQIYISRVTAVVSYIWSRWGKQISAFTSSTFRSVLLAIKSALEVVSGIVKVVTGLMTGNWRQAGDGIKKIASGLAGSLLATFGLSKTDLLRVASSLWGSLKKTWSDGVAALGRIWDGIKETAKQPIRFVVQTVLEDGILAAVRTISGAVGFDAGKNLHVSLPSGFTTGGIPSDHILPGSSRWQDGDDQIIRARKGEGIVMSEVLADPYERQRFMLANRLAKQGRPLSMLQGFAGGGLVGGAGSWTPRFETILLKASQIFGHPFSVYQRGFRPETSYSGTSHAGDAVDLGPATALVVKILRSLGVASWRRGPGFPGGFPFPHIHGVPLPGYGQAGGQGVWQAQDYLRGGDGLGGRDYEARPGKIGILGKIGAFIKSGFNSVADWFKSLVAGPLKKLDRIGNSPFGQMASKLPGMAIEGLAGKFKLFDRGGDLPPGLTLAMNGTGRPEKILTDEQWQRFANPGGRMAPLASYDGANFYGFPADFFAQQQQQLERVATMHGRWDG